MNTRILSTSLVPIVLALGFSTIASAQNPQDGGYEPRFESAPCPFEAGEEVLSQFRCGHLIVPENRASPEGRQLRLAVAVLSSRSETPRPDPLVVLPGGPGAPILSNIASAAASPLREDREVVFYDPRGTGFSEPSICAELNAEWQRVTWMGGLSLDERRGSQLAALERCRAEVEREGVDLSQYNTVVNARDLDDLRRVLGIEQWNLWGRSYGTRVALEALRVTPGGVRSVILDAPSPSNVPGPMERSRVVADAVSRFLALCSEDSSCDAVLPDAERQFWEAIEKLDQDPLVLRTGGRNGLPDPLVVDGLTLAAGVMNVLYSRTLRGIVPLVIRAAGARNEAFMGQVASQMGRDPETVARWVNITANCHERHPFRSLTSPVPLHERGQAVLARIGMDPDPALCDAWHPFRAPQDFGEPIVSATPVLILTGEFDPVTHRSYGAAAAEGLAKARVFEVPGGAHVEGPRHPCTREVVQTFLDDPEQPLNTECLAALPGVRFITDPAELLRAPAGR